MKRYGKLFQTLISDQNLAAAHHNARKGKRYYREVKMVDASPAFYLRWIREMLDTGTFRTGAYTVMTRNDYGKDRVIHKLPYFPDRIIHHALVQVLAPIWYKTLIRDTYACVPGRGIHDGVRRIKKALKDRSATQYCLKMDVRKFYHSMDPNVLKAILRQKIKDARVLDLMDEIIDSFSPGVPIGNYLSQFFANLYLSGYDHYMKENEKCRYFFRYCDDVVVLGPGKDRLHALRKTTARYWSDHLNVDLKGNWQVFPVDVRGIDFLGYRFFHDYTLLRKSIAQKFKRKIGKVKSAYQQMTPTAVISGVMSYEGWMRHANCHNLRRQYFDDELKQAVAAAARSGHVKCPDMLAA